MNQESYKKIDELNAIIGNLSLSDLNRVLYRADPEERDDGNGGGVYVLPETGALVYCGFQGMCLSVLWFSRYELECFVIYRYALWSTIVHSFKFVFSALHMIFIYTKEILLSNDTRKANLDAYERIDK